MSLMNFVCEIERFVHFRSVSKWLPCMVQSVEYHTVCELSFAANSTFSKRYTASLERSVTPARTFSELFSLYSSCNLDNSLPVMCQEILISLVRSPSSLDLEFWKESWSTFDSTDHSLAFLAVFVRYSVRLSCLTVSIPSAPAPRRTR